jgi:hypothetical protein
MNRQIESGIVLHKSARYHKHEQERIRVRGAREEGTGGISYLLCASHSLSATFSLPAGPSHVSRSGIYLAFNGYSSYKFHSKQVIRRILGYSETVTYCDVSQDRVNKENQEAYRRNSP